MLKSTLIVIAISIAAGATIRAWAFASFAFLLVAALGVVTLLKGSAFTGVVASCIEVLVLMEICYLAGLFAFSFGGQIHKRRKRNSIANRSQMTGKHPH